MLKEIAEKALRENKKVYVFAHKNPDGDAIGSACAVRTFMKTNGVDCEYVISNPDNSFAKITGNIPETDSVEPGNISVIVDTSSVSYSENQLFNESSANDIYVIDHHIKADGFMCIEDELGLPSENVIRKSDESSACEVIENDIPTEMITPKIADNLTLGLLTDTVNLKYIRENTLTNLSKLIFVGANIEKVNKVVNKKVELKSQVGTSNIMKDVKVVEIKNSFGIILPVGYEKVSELKQKYGIDNIQKTIQEMNDIENCSFNCIVSETEPGEFDINFRSTPFFGNFDVQSLAVSLGGGGHYNASGCHLSSSDGYDMPKILKMLSEQLKVYSELEDDSQKIKLSENDNKLLTILNDTEKMTKNVSFEKIKEVDKLVKEGANYAFLIRDFKTFAHFMIRNELLSKIKQKDFNKKNIKILFNEKELDYLKSTYLVSEKEILDEIKQFEKINVKSVYIELPNGKNAFMENGIIKESDGLNNTVKK